MPDSAEIKIEGQNLEFPVIEGSEKEKGIDLGKLRAQTGYVALDPASSTRPLSRAP